MYCLIASKFWTAFAAFMFNYQTLIAGILAVAAAGLAGAPVWRQLRMMRAQTEAGFRQIVVDRLKETVARAVEARAFVATPMDDIGRITQYCADGEIPEVDSQWAFHLESNVTGARQNLEAWASSHRDVGPVEAAKAKLIDALKIVESVLYDVHRPDSTADMGEDQDISPEVYAEWNAESEIAKGKLGSSSGAVMRSLRALEAEYTNLRASLNQRLRQIDDQIIGGRN